MQKKFEFLTLASHQLRTPLTNIKWNLQIIKKDGYKGMNKKQTEKMKKMYSSTERMLKLISELVNVNDIDNKTAVVEVDREETDINEIINMVLDELESLIINNEIKITYDEEILKGIKKNIDKHKITSVFTSIIKNAIEYSDHGRRDNYWLYKG